MWYNGYQHHFRLIFIMSELRAHYRLENELRIQIMSGFLPDYHRLYPENVLAARYHISRCSVRQALANLEADGLIFRKRGSGTFVVPELQRKKVAIPRENGKVILYLSFSSLYSRETFQGVSTFRTVYEGLKKILTPAGYDFRAAHVGIDWQAPAVLSDPAIGGVIFEGVVRKDFFDKYLADKPVIGVNCYNPDLACSWVLEDSRQVSELSVKHLYSRGYRKIAILSDEAFSSPIQEALMGYYAGLHQSGLPVREEYVIFWDRDRVNGELCNEGLVKTNFAPRLKEIFSSADHPDAVICQDSFRADQTLEALLSLGLDVPGDVALMCRTGRSSCSRFGMVYEGFNARKIEVFAEAAKEIIEEIENRTAVSGRITYMRPLLVKGDSVPDKNIKSEN